MWDVSFLFNIGLDQGYNSLRIYKFPNLFYAYPLSTIIKFLVYGTSVKLILISNISVLIYNNDLGTAEVRDRYTLTLNTVLSLRDVLQPGSCILLPSWLNFL
jgi:hypothetical protein